MTNHLGDFALSTVVYGKFATYRPSTGATFTLGGTPALSVYKDNSTTQSTAGVTLTADFDTVTGLNHFAVDTSADGTFYSSGSFFDIVITTGTVDSISVTGSVVGSFTLNATSSLRPATAGHTLTVDGSGDVTFNNTSIGSVTGSVGSVTGAVGSVTGAVGSISGITFPTNFDAFVIDVNGRIDLGSILGTASAGTAGYVGIDWSHINAPTTTVALSGTTIASSSGTLPSQSFYPITQSTATYNLLIYVGTTGLTLTAQLSKNGGAFAAAAGAVSELADGWYLIAGNATDSGTLGPLIAVLLNAGTPVGFGTFLVVPYSPNALPAAQAGTAGGLPVLSTNSGTMTLSGGLVTAITGNITGNLSGSVGSVTAAVAITSNIKKNQALTSFQFVMTDSTNHNPATGLTVSAERSIDGAAFAACANSPTEVGNGDYVINLAAADLNGNTIVLLFTAPGADNRLIEIVTQP